MRKKPKAQQSEKEEIKTLTKIIRGVLAYWIVFVAISWVTYWIKGSVPDTLVQYGLGGGAVELVAGAAIEIGKAWIEKRYHLHEHTDNDDTGISWSSVDSVDSEQLPDAGSEGNVG